MLVWTLRVDQGRESHATGLTAESDLEGGGGGLGSLQAPRGRGKVKARRPNTSRLGEKRRTVIPGGEAPGAQWRVGPPLSLRNSGRHSGTKRGEMSPGNGHE